MIRILIVEDENIIRKGLVYTIDWTSMDCVIVGEAKNGEEGIAKIEELKPDIVITDIRMPKLDGLEMLQQANNIHKFESIVISSYSEFEYAKQAIKLGVFDYLLKPIDEDKLKLLISKVKDEIMSKKIYKEIKKQVKNIDQITILDIDQYSNSSKIKSKYTKKAIKFIVRNYKVKISVEELSDKLDVSSSYLSRKFKQETGHTFNNFINRYRVQKSLELLETGEYKVYEIADLVGFSNYKYFSKVFKDYLNCSPLEFANSNWKERVN
jgi:two-component system response regulator YesN